MFYINSVILSINAKNILHADNETPNIKKNQLVNTKFIENINNKNTDNNEVNKDNNNIKSTNHPNINDKNLTNIVDNKNIIGKVSYVIAYLSIFYLNKKNKAIEKDNNEIKKLLSENKKLDQNIKKEELIKISEELVKNNKKEINELIKYANSTNNELEQKIQNNHQQELSKLQKKIQNDYKYNQEKNNHLNKPLMEVKNKENINQIIDIQKYTSNQNNKKNTKNSHKDVDEDIYFDKIIMKEILEQVNKLINKQSQDMSKLISNNNNCIEKLIQKNFSNETQVQLYQHKENRIKVEQDKLQIQKEANNNINSTNLKMLNIFEKILYNLEKPELQPRYQRIEFPDLFNEIIPISSKVYFNFVNMKILENFNTTYTNKLIKEEKINEHVYLFGDRGTGKTKIVDLIFLILGPDTIRLDISESNEINLKNVLNFLIENENSKFLLFFDEFKYQGDVEKSHKTPLLNIMNLKNVNTVFASNEDIQNDNTMAFSDRLTKYPFQNDISKIEMFFFQISEAFYEDLIQIKNPQEKLINNFTNAIKIYITNTFKENKLNIKDNDYIINIQKILGFKDISSKQTEEKTIEEKKMEENNYQLIKNIMVIFLKISKLVFIEIAKKPEMFSFRKIYNILNKIKKSVSNITSQIPNLQAFKEDNLDNIKLYGIQLKKIGTTYTNHDNTNQRNQDNLISNLLHLRSQIVEKEDKQTDMSKETREKIFKNFEFNDSAKQIINKNTFKEQVKYLYNIYKDKIQFLNFSKNKDIIILKINSLIKNLNINDYKNDTGLQSIAMDFLFIHAIYLIIYNSQTSSSFLGDIIKDYQKIFVTDIKNQIQDINEIKTPKSIQNNILKSDNNKLIDNKIKLNLNKSKIVQEKNINHEKMEDINSKLEDKNIKEQKSPEKLQNNNIQIDETPKKIEMILKSICDGIDKKIDFLNMLNYNVNDYTKSINQSIEDLQNKRNEYQKNEKDKTKNKNSFFIKLEFKELVSKHFFN